MAGNKENRTITSEEYDHLPSATHKLVVDALIERGEWRRVPAKRTKGGS